MLKFLVTAYGNTRSVGGCVLAVDALLYVCCRVVHLIWTPIFVYFTCCSHAEILFHFQFYMGSKENTFLPHFTITPGWDQTERVLGRLTIFLI